jgi:DNA-binding beta-propeller fold protein YncE
VYVGNEGSGSVSVIDTATNAISAAIPGIPHADVGAISGAFVYVASASEVRSKGV